MPASKQASSISAAVVLAAAVLSEKRRRSSLSFGACPAAFSVFFLAFHRLATTDAICSARERGSEGRRAPRLREKGGALEETLDVIFLSAFGVVVVGRGGENDEGKKKKREPIKFFFLRLSFASSCPFLSPPLSRNNSIWLVVVPLTRMNTHYRNRSRSSCSLKKVREREGVFFFERDKKNFDVEKKGVPLNFVRSATVWALSLSRSRSTPGRSIRYSDALCGS